MQLFDCPALLTTRVPREASNVAEVRELSPLGSFRKTTLFRWLEASTFRARLTGEAVTASPSSCWGGDTFAIRGVVTVQGVVSRGRRMMMIMFLVGVHTSVLTYSRTVQ